MTNIAHNHGGCRLQGEPSCTYPVERNGVLVNCGEDGDIYPDGSIRCPACYEDEYYAENPDVLA
jgi:hypothetical protein